ncbi:MAG: hypothetical protein E6K53_10245 [Gammaproteobacteria bacterium]|nr:MAG: hypothetical protein E6K53_10245 [Gammaproteobacteria bacterium]
MSNFDKNALPEWTTQAKRLLDDSANGLDAATLSRLNRARQAALTTRARRPAQFWFLPAGLASACALLLALAVWQPHHAGGDVSSPSAAAVAADVDDGSADTPEFYQDLEFYAWLDAQNAQRKEGEG